MPIPADVLAKLKNRVSSLENPRGTDRGMLSFGVDALDRSLPGLGLPLGSLHEVSEASKTAVSHAAATTLFVAAIAARLNSPCLWITPAPDLFAPGLAGVGLTPEKLLVAEAVSAKGVLALMEEGLRSPALGCVVGEVAGLGLPQSRRLQLAAETGGVTAIVLRRWAANDQPSAAMTRWRITSEPSARIASAGIGRARMRVELLRCRGAERRVFMMEAPDAEGRLALVDALEHRSLVRRAA